MLVRPQESPNLNLVCGITSVEYPSMANCSILFAVIHVGQFTRGNRKWEPDLLSYICQSPTTDRKHGTAKPLGEGASNSIQNYLVKTTPKSAEHELNKSITFGLAKDLRPLHMVEGLGLKHLAQALINFGAKFGH